MLRRVANQARYYTNVSKPELQGLMKSGATVIDVRGADGTCESLLHK